jgi:ribosome-interacting GTPase 1
MTQGSSGGGEGFEVTKFGHGRVALIGFPRFANLLLSNKDKRTEMPFFSHQIILIDLIVYMSE